VLQEYGEDGNLNKNSDRRGSGNITSAGQGVCQSDLELLEAGLPEYTGESYVQLNGGVPFFDAEDITDESFTRLSEQDFLGRCGTAAACFGPDTVAEGERGSIGHIRPSGWHTAKYPGLVDGLYLYNRSHLLMWKLSGILDDDRNLITGTRYMNTEGMLPFEEMTVDYIESTGNHVMYRATPYFLGSEMVARGVALEAFSVEDDGAGISFNVYCFNVQPGVEIDYASGESSEAAKRKGKE